jgi:hypothetical protein
VTKLGLNLALFLTYREAVKTICKRLPQLNVVSSFALIIKSINSERKRCNIILSFGVSNTGKQHNYGIMYIRKIIISENLVV